jgi:mannitol 2-dehydrogenase
MTPPQLTQALLRAGIDGDAVATPRYERDSLRVGLVHIGVGGFHQSHQAVYLDELMNAGLAADWAICGVGVLPTDRRMADTMAAQDCLYTVVVQSGSSPPTARILGCMTKYLFAPEDPEAVLAQLVEESVRIVSLTVTEDGYNIDPITGAFDMRKPHGSADSRNDRAPTTWFGLVTKALRRRRARGIPPFAVLSCDNLERNGEVCRRSVCGHAELLDPELAVWIAENVAFPDSMVDRITRRTTDADRARFSDDFGFSDEWPVYCEPFRQWVLQDVFSAGRRPPLERAGVQFVENVGPYELMKLRLLNGGHQALAHLGSLAGHQYVQEAGSDAALSEFLRAYLAEVSPSLLPVPGIDLEDYKESLLLRFNNPAIGDRLDRIGAYASDRMPKFVVAPLRQNLQAGRDIRCGALVIAAWAESVRAIASGERALPLVDSRAESLLRRAAEPDPLAFLADQELFGALATDDVFAATYRRTVSALRVRGARASAQLAARQA